MFSTRKIFVKSLFCLRFDECIRSQLFIQEKGVCNFSEETTKMIHDGSVYIFQKDLANQV